MRSSTFSASALLLGALTLVHGQTYTDCDPTKKTCPNDPALGTTLTTDFTKGASSDWTLAAGTTLTYDGSNGAQFTIKDAGNAPTISSAKYIFFGKVEVVTKASPGTGTVSSFILESDDLDEIDWEWLGSTDSSVESNFFGKGNTTTYDRAIYHNVADPQGTWHTYTIDWTSQSIIWSIDGGVVRTLTYSDPLTIGGANYPQTPMRVKMGSWIGCADAAAASNPATQGTCQWAGGPIDLTKGPYVMSVKSVTIQDYGCATDYQYSDMSGSYQSIKSIGGCNGGAGSGSSSASGSGSGSSSSASSTKASSSSSSSPSSTAPPSTSASGTTTLSPATFSTVLPQAVTSTGSSSASASTAKSEAPTMKPKHKYGYLDMGVMALGLGLGYLVM